MLRNTPWMLTGDFNEIIDNTEKTGGPQRAEGTFCDFRTFLSENDLFDLKHSGNSLSWRGVRHTHTVHCRLDRALANSTWLDNYPRGNCEYLNFEGSDHRPLLTQISTKKRPPGKLFRYDRQLSSNKKVRKLIHKTWRDARGKSVQQRIELCRRAISTWMKQHHKNNRKVIDELKRKLEQAMSSTHADEEAIHCINSELRKAYRSEESFWKQRSRQLWLTLGDRNTAYFHAATRGRRAVNKLSVIEDKNGTAQHEDEEIATVFQDFYQDLFTSQGEVNIEIVEEALKPKVSEETNRGLINIPDEEEIRSALFSINPGKAPGPDGFSSCFFQTNWSTLKPEIVSEIAEFFESEILPEKMNHTHVRLIPKTTGAKTAPEYRPIALCNVYFKIISKILTKRIQPVLKLVISETQSAFVPGRAISDNVLITHEVLHFLKNSGAEKRVAMAVKTDMSKAYDRLEWSFIRKVLERLGFHQRLVNWIMQCIRQGDPLSPYIFILCSEVLSGLCRKAQAAGNLQGIRVSKQSPRVNHLLFADDTMFFCQSDNRSCQTLKNVLHKYETASGQKINTSKSSIAFSRKTSPERKSQAKQILGIDKEGGNGKYLGLPEHWGRKKKDLFTNIVDRIRQRAASWSSKCLSPAGKMIMLKSVLSAMPNHTMTCFKIPKGLCKRIQSALTRFWWDSNPEKKKMCWVSWERLAKSKKMGGLGFRDIETFNDALLAKQSWRLLTNPRCLLARVLLGKYAKGKHFLSCTTPNSGSHGWRGLIAGKELLKLKLGKVIGNGKETPVWSEPWISLTNPIAPVGPPTRAASDLLVADLINPLTKTWDKTKIKEILPQWEDDILKLQPSKTMAPDRYVWLGEKSGQYSTKTGYHAAIQSKDTTEQQTQSQNNIDWNTTVWKRNTSPKLQLFLWKILQGALPTGENLARRTLVNSSQCNRCGELETTDHLFLHCPYAQQVWNLIPTQETIRPTEISSFQEGLNISKDWTCLPPTGIKNTSIYSWICWSIWYSRNKLIFEARDIAPREVGTKALREAREWKNTQERIEKKETPKKQHFPPIPKEQRLDSISCFSDGAWKLNSTIAGLGANFVDFSGKHIKEISVLKEDIYSPLMAEATALLEAMNYAKRQGWNRLRFHADSQTLIQAINTGLGSNELYGLLQDVHAATSSFESVSFSYIPRKNNAVADHLAKAALSSVFDSEILARG